MGKTHEWSPTSRGKALGLCAAGTIPLREITNIIGIPKSTIGNINARGTGISKPRSGCPRKLSARDIRPIVRFLRTNKTTRRYSLTQLKEYFELDVHENTIWKALQEAGYYYRIARRPSYLNKWDRQRGLKFAKEHKDWTVEE